MKRIAAILFSLAFGYGLAAEIPPQGEAIEFRFEPSFRDGILVWMARTPNGKVHCSAYKLPIADDGGIASHSKVPPKLLKEAVVSSADFDALVSALEGRELRIAAEADSSGLDGTAWTFLRKAGGRQINLRFWTPERNLRSPALALGRRFVALAQIQDAFPKEEPNQASEPTAPSGRGSS